MNNKNEHFPVYENYEEMKGLEDGYVGYKGKKITNNFFECENELANYIINNIKKFAQSYLNDTIKSFERECQIHKRIRFAPRGRRVDLFIEGNNKEYVIEFKTPSSGSEIRYGLGQMLDYGREFFDSDEYKETELLLISDLYDSNTAKTIEYFDLPIRYIYFDKNISLEVMEIE